MLVWEEMSYKQKDKRLKNSREMPKEETAGKTRMRVEEIRWRSKSSSCDPGKF